MSDNTQTVAELAAEIKTDFATKFEAVQNIAKDALGRVEKGEPLAQGAKEEADKALVAANEAKARLDDIEQKLARRGSSETDEQKSLGEQFVESDSFKSLINDPRQRGKAALATKATITLATTATAGAAGDAVAPTRLAGIQALPQRRMTIRDLITAGQMDGNSLEYVRETGFTNNAATVAENTRKPESDLTLDLITTSARVIAHYMKASRQVLDDAAQLRTTIDNRLLYGLAFREEAQILNGDGTGQNLLGIVPQATAYAAPGGLVAGNSMDTVRLAMLQASLAEFPASGIVMHPTDWARMEILKDTAGGYIIGNPQGQVAPTLWGLPVVATQAIAQDTVLVGAFQLGAQLFDRWAARVELSTENEDDFVNNRVTILAEERLALAVYRPEAFVRADLGFVA